MRREDGRHHSRHNLVDERRQGRRSGLEVRSDNDAASNEPKGEPIVSCAIPRVSMDESNLVITNINTADGGNYTCHVKSELEEKSASARLMVMGMSPSEINPISTHA